MDQSRYLGNIDHFGLEKSRFFSEISLWEIWKCPAWNPNPPTQRQTRENGFLSVCITCPATDYRPCYSTRIHISWQNWKALNFLSGLASIGTAATGWKIQFALFQPIACPWLCVKIIVMQKLRGAFRLHDLSRPFLPLIYQFRATAQMCALSPWR